MTVVSFYDILARDAASGGADGAAKRLAAFVEKLIAASLTRFSQLGEYERQFALAVERDPEVASAMRLIWRLYLDWADEAEQILSRTDALRPEHGSPTGLRELNEAFGHTRARLTVTPEQIARAKEQVRRGRIVPAKELRDELHARLRP